MSRRKKMRPNIRKFFELYFTRFLDFCIQHHVAIGAIGGICGTLSLLLFVITSLYGCYGTNKTNYLIKENTVVLGKLADVIEPLTLSQLNSKEVTYAPIPAKKPPLPKEFADIKLKKSQISHLVAMCIMAASQTYKIPPAIIVGVAKKEAGSIGEQYKKKNGTYDFGLMKINSSKISILAKKWEVSEKTATKWVKDDACTNIGVGASQLSNFYSESQSWREAIGKYDEDPKTEKKYAEEVIMILKENGLMKEE